LIDTVNISRNAKQISIIRLKWWTLRRIWGDPKTKKKLSLLRRQWWGQWGKEKSRLDEGEIVWKNERNYRRDRRKTKD